MTESGFTWQSAEYARHRPHYPDELFDYVAALCPRQQLAWDCATGSGQAAVALAHRFRHVRATDASAEQIAHAIRHPRVSYVVARADESGLADGCVDLVTVATALHWLDLDRFYPEAERVLSPEGVIAAWSYRDNRISTEVDAVLLHFRRNVVGADWAFDMTILDERYRTVPFPFEELPVPIHFTARAEWTLAQVYGYLASWSATQRYRNRTGSDPIELIRPQLDAAWGDPATRRTVEWPLFMRVGRKGKQ